MTTLSPDQFRRVEQLFHEASSMPMDQREAFVRDSCDDAVVQAEVLGMLEHLGAGLATPTPGTIMAMRAPLSDSVEAATLVGQDVGAYHIEGIIGRGGMGVVYRARDMRLRRPVAIKTLPYSWSDAPAQLARFAREAKLLASLSHPNLATVFGLEEYQGSKLLVMEWIEGSTLARRLSKGPLPIDEALRVTRQIASAVEAAHEAGVIHRDLKPGNVMLTPEDNVKVLDFGLARSTPLPGGMAAHQSTHPSRTTDGPATREGAILGTPGYMSPELIRGRPLDRRADIFALGCILYECLTGRMAFGARAAGGGASGGGASGGGNSGADMMVHILERDPDWSLLPPRTPTSIRRLLQRCMAKDPQQRMRDIGDVGQELDEALAARDWLGPATATPRPSPAARLVPIIGVPAIIALLILAAVALWLRPQPVVTSRTRLSRFTIEFPNSLPQQQLAKMRLALSRDGKRLIYLADKGDGIIRLWQRDLDKLLAVELPDTEDTWFPFLSPDGQSLGYFQQGVLKTRRLDGGQATRLADCFGWGGQWADDCTINFTFAWAQPIFRVSQHGGTLKPVSSVRFDQGERSYPTSFQLRNGKAMLIGVWYGKETTSLYAQDLTSSDRKLVIENGGAPRLAMTPRGEYLLFERGGTLFAAPFDEDRVAVTGPETAIVDSVLTDPSLFSAAYDVSDEGTLAYVPGPFVEKLQLAWADSQKGRGSMPFPPAEGLPVADPRFSADGRKLSVILKGAVYLGYLYDLDRGTFTRVSSEHDTSAGAVSPNGKWYAYGSLRSDRYSVWLKNLDTGAEICAMEPQLYPVQSHWSADSRHLVFCMSPDELSPRDIYVLRVSEDGRPQGCEPFFPSPWDEHHPTLSPNGKWMAYGSNETAIREVYLRSFPDGNIKWQVSFGGGMRAEWSPDGKTLYYRHRDQLLASTLDPDTGQPLGKPTPIWRGSFGLTELDATDFTVAPDGRLLVIEHAPDAPTVNHINVILNWHELLPR